ncbi:MAG: MFS transporter [Planctomycetota bacterium]
MLWVPRFAQRPELFLSLLAAAAAIGFSAWRALLNNYAVDDAGFSGADIGTLQSIREIPGLLAFCVVYLLLLWREQRLAWVSVAVLGIGTALTGLDRSALSLYATTFVMSVGFHIYETLQGSLALQWFPRGQAPVMLGRIIAVSSIASVLTYGLIWAAVEMIDPPLPWLYLTFGAIAAALALLGAAFRPFPQPVPQRRRLVLRRSYGLYYALTFLSGARRQIFVVFAGFMLVERFGFDVAAMSLLFLITTAASAYLAPLAGRFINAFGERRALQLEYGGLIAVFVGYALVHDSRVAVGLYVLDHVFYALAMSIKTYFQKIADPADIAPTAGVAFTINHIAAVVIPVGFGLLWTTAPAAVFWSGAGMAAVSLVLACAVPRHPMRGAEFAMVGVRSRRATTSPDA